MHAIKSIYSLGDLTFEEFAKSSLGEELMPPEEVVAGTDLVVREDETSRDDGDQPSAMDDDSTAKQAEQFASELSRSTTMRKRNLMTSSLGVSESCHRDSSVCSVQCVCMHMCVLRLCLSVWYVV